MVIEFMCPNGHPLSAALDRAGKPGKCPKCGTQFLVPDEEEEPEASDGPLPQSDETIEFLCPQGHRLTGPARLQGRPGQCPHCGEKFYVPNYEEEEEEDEQEGADQQIPMAAPAEEDEILEVEDIVAISEEVEMIDEPDAPQVGGSGDSGRAISSTTIGARPAMADLFAWFWERRTEQNEVELHLRSGEVVVPQFFAKELSGESCGAFAVQHEDGSFTISAIAWDAIERLSMSQVRELPEGFD